jgi:hypothetical protein
MELSKELTYYLIKELEGLEILANKHNKDKGEILYMLQSLKRCINILRRGELNVF